MSLLGELLAEAGLELASYAIGKGAALLLLPHLGIEPLSRQPKQKSLPPWKWRGFTYEQNGRRYLYTESIQLLGIAVVLVLIIGVTAFVRHLTW